MFSTTYHSGKLQQIFIWLVGWLVGVFSINTAISETTNIYIYSSSTIVTSLNGQI